MSLSRDDVSAIAAYCRIALTDAELDEMCAYMNDAVELLEPIRSFDLEGVEPTFHPIGGLVNVTGEDVADDARELSVDEALGNAHATHGRSFRVPSILGEEDDL